jgi:ferredoxin-NADP reductase
MPIHTLRLITRREVARQTILCSFNKPEGFQFKAGQYGGFTLINPPMTDEKGATRRLSILSAPQDEHLSVAVRIQGSAFKRVLSECPLGSEIKFAGPTGNFTLHEDQSIPAVFLAGGIGITPFYSMLRTVTLDRLPYRIYLFYGNQTPEDAALLPELAFLQEQNPNLTVINTMANPHPNWHGETGYITDSLLKKYLPDLNQPLFYACGSPAMVIAMQTMLSEMGIAATKVKVEDFPGY